MIGANFLQSPAQLVVFLFPRRQQSGSMHNFNLLFLIMCTVLYSSVLYCTVMYCTVQWWYRRAVLYLVVTL